MMQKTKLKKLALALGLGLGSLGMVPSAQSMNLATDGLGQVLIFPYYTVRGGWTTLFNLTNTSNQILAIKIRFHESYNSRDVLDFNVIMSPNDVWNGWVALDSASGGPAFFTRDNSCTTLNASAYAGLDLGTDGLPFQSDVYGTSGADAYTDGGSGNNADGGPTTVSRMNEGYIEAILMASSVVPPATGAGANALIRGAVHTNGVPTGCAALANAFYIWNNYVTLFDGPTYGAALGTSATALGFTAPIDPVTGGPLNPLKGSYNLVNGAKGWTAAGAPTTIADFAVQNNLLTSMLPPGVPPAPVGFSQSFLEPSLNSGDNAAAGVVPPNNAALPVLAANGVGAVSDLLARTHVINQWTRITSTVDSAWVTATNWVLNFPTKGFYVDNLAESAYAARSAARNAAVGAALANNIISVPAVVPVQGIPAEPFTSFFADSVVAAVPQLNGRSCFPVGISIYDREEIPLANGVSPGGNNLCYETNVLTFGSPTVSANNILSAAEPKGLAALSGENGYLDLALIPVNAGNLVIQGLPAISFAITSRDTGNGTLNEAFLIDAAYSRGVPPANP